MSNSVELGLVLDTTQYMYYAIKDIKDNLKDILRVIPKGKALPVFSGFLSLLCIYHMCANQKPKQLKRNNGYHQPNEPPPRVIPVEDETEPINTMKSDYKQQIIKIKQL
eukprot:93792_1